MRPPPLVSASDLIDELIEEVKFEFHDRADLQIQDRRTSNQEWLFTALMYKRKQFRQYTKLGFGNLKLGSVMVTVLTLLIPMLKVKFELECAKEHIRAYVLIHGRFSNAIEAAGFKNKLISFIRSTHWDIYPTAKFLDEWYEKAYLEVLMEEGRINV